MPETSSHASAASSPTTVLDQSAQSHLESLYRAAVGPIHTDYYLPILLRFEAYGRVSPSWNWAACACTLNWMVFRALWLPALAYLGTVAAAIAVVWLVIAQTAPPMGASLRWSLWAGLATLVLLVPGFFGNAWLYRAYHQRLDQALAQTNSLHDACQLLARGSRTRPRLVAIVLANLALAALLAIGFWPKATPTHTGPRASGEVENVAAPALAAAAPASAATEVANSVAAPVMAPIAQPQSAASAPQAVTRASLPDFDLQTVGAGARGGLAQDAAIRKHSRSNRHRRPITATEPNPTTAAAQATLPAAAAATATATAAAPATGTPAPAAHDSNHFLINVGLFAQQDNALRAVARLKAAGLPATSTMLETPNGPRSRVQAGPFTGRAQADAAAQQIRTIRLDADVIRQ